MALIRRDDDTVIESAEAIARALEPLGVTLAEWPLGSDPELRALLGQVALADDEKARVLAGLDGYFVELKARLGYQARDLIVLHAGVPGLPELLAKFERCHTHDDDEVRYIVDGEGVFGFVCPDGRQLELTVRAGEYINVPANTEHWFHLTHCRRIKAVRYFTNTAGWVPVYTGTAIRFG